MQTMTPPTQPLQQQQAQPQYEITEEDKKRQKMIASAWRAYNGDLDKPLLKLDGQPDDNVMSNRCQPIVDRGVDFLFGKEIEITAAEDASEEAQKLLDTTWGRKERRLPLLQKLAMNGALAGQAFLRIMPEADSTFRLIVVDPSTVFVKTAPQDCETVLLYCIEYSTNEQRLGKPVQVFYREEIARIDPDGDGDDGDPSADVDTSWQIQHWTRMGERGPWTPAGAPITWEYHFPPIFSAQNLPKPNDTWGIPDLTPDIVGVNNSLNLVQSNINRINKLYGSPILFATGTGQQDIDIRPGKIIGLPLSESKIMAVPITSDIASALAFAENLRSDIDEQSSVPGVATGRITSMPRGNLSGVAIELLFEPLLKKTEKKRCLYGDLIIDVSEALFVLAGLGEDIEVTISWQYPLPSDDLGAVQAAVLKKDVGVSNTTLQRELGYDPEEEQQLSQKEDAEKMAQMALQQSVLPPTVTPTTPQTPQPGEPMQAQITGGQ